MKAYDSKEERKHYCGFHRTFFQINIRFIWHLSTNVYDVLCVEPSRNFRRIANHSSGSSWVHSIISKISNILECQFCIIWIQLQHGNVVPVLLTIFTGLMALALVFINCELCQRISDAYEQVDITIVQFEWYLFPNDIQRMLPIIIANAQQPVELECFGSIKCGREVFKNVGAEQSCKLSK